MSKPINTNIFYSNEFSLMDSKLNSLGNNNFEVISKFKGKDTKSVLIVKSTFKNFENNSYIVTSDVSQFLGDNLSSQNAIYNMKLKITDNEKANPFLLMIKVFNNVKTTNLLSTIDSYSDLNPNTFSMKLYGSSDSGSASTTISSKDGESDYFNLSKKIKKNTTWISESLLSNEIKNSEYLRKNEKFRKIITIEEFKLSNTGKTGNGLYKIQGIQDSKILFESKGLIDINFYNGNVSMYENIKAPWDKNINLMADNEPEQNNPVKDEFVNGHLTLNGNLIESYSQKLSTGDVADLIVEYILSEN